MPFLNESSILSTENWLNTLSSMVKSPCTPSFSPVDLENESIQRRKPMPGNSRLRLSAISAM